jgi:hypothetical protein
MNDRGRTTELQRAQWEAQTRYRPRDLSIIQRVFRHPATFFVSLAIFCALLILIGIGAVWKL